MKVKLWLPIYADAEFEAEIEDVENKSAMEVSNEFWDNIKRSKGGLCHHCSDKIRVDFDVREDYPDSEMEDAIRDLKMNLEDL